MRPYSQQDLKDEFKRLNYKWPKFHLTGVRNKVDSPNLFDDMLYLHNGDQMYSFTGTTNPGTDWLTSLMNPKGAAVLVPKQYIDTWQLGRHHDEYVAWTQAKPVSVYRDKNQDLKSDEVGVPEIGMFGINIHHANGSARSKFVGKWSAGCQVFDNPTEFDQFISLSQLSQQKFFTYTLLREIL